MKGNSAEQDQGRAAPSVAWRSHLVVLGIIVIIHGAAIYFITRARSSRSLGTDGPPLFAPVISKVWVPERMGISSRPWRAELTDATPPSTHWKFATIDLWPSAAGWSAIPSEFTPVTEATPDPPEIRTVVDQTGRSVTLPVKRQAGLRMVRWLRPTYSTGCASADTPRSVALELRIGPDGKPAQITVHQSSGLSELDDAAIHAAELWRFSPPVWKQHRIEVWGQIELRFNC